MDLQKRQLTSINIYQIIFWYKDIIRKCLAELVRTQVTICSPLGFSRQIANSRIFKGPVHNYNMYASDLPLVRIKSGNVFSTLLRM